MPNARFLDLHIVQTVPPSCINRDDTGAPKKAVYGGVVRHRVSSQAWKRVARSYMQSEALIDSATRSRRHNLVIAKLASQLEGSQDLPLEALLITATAVVNGLVGKPGAIVLKDADLAAARAVLAGDVEVEEAPAQAEGDEPGASQDDTDNSEGGEGAKGDGPQDKQQGTTLLSLTDGERLALAEPVVQLTRKALAAKNRTVSADAHGKTKLRHHIIESAKANDQDLFGRFVAGTPGATVAATVHVAHAISTHVAYSEDDAYTALGDTEDDQIVAGADMLGVTEYTSSTLYRYARIDLDDLAAREGVGEQSVADLAGAVVEAFALSMPKGRGAGFAPDSVPATVTVVLRSDRPVSAAPAFERPVRAADGYEAESVRRLASYLQDVEASGLVDTALVTASASVAYETIGQRLTGGRLRSSVSELVAAARR